MNKETANPEDDILYVILKKYSEKDESLPVDEFIRQELAASGKFSKGEVEETARIISDTIASNSRNFREIQEYKTKKGLSTSFWLRDLLDKVTAGFSPEARSSLIVSIKDSLNRSNLELVSKMTKQDVTKIGPPLETDNFTEHHRNAIADNLLEELKINANVQCIVMEKAMIPENDNKEKKNGE